MTSRQSKLQELEQINKRIAETGNAIRANERKQTEALRKSDVPTVRETIRAGKRLAEKYLEEYDDAARLIDELDKLPPM